MLDCVVKDLREAVLTDSEDVFAQSRQVRLYESSPYTVLVAIVFERQCLFNNLRLKCVALPPRAPGCLDQPVLQQRVEMTMNGLSGDAKMLSRHLCDVLWVRLQFCEDESSDFILGDLLQVYVLPLSTPA